MEINCFSSFVRALWEFFVPIGGGADRDKRNTLRDRNAGLNFPPPGDIVCSILMKKGVTTQCSEVADAIAVVVAKVPVVAVASAETAAGSFSLSS